MEAEGVRPGSACACTYAHAACAYARMHRVHMHACSNGGCTSVHVQTSRLFELPQFLYGILTGGPESLAMQTMQSMRVGLLAYLRARTHTHTHTHMHRGWVTRYLRIYRGRASLCRLPARFHVYRNCGSLNRRTGCCMRVCVRCIS